MNLSQQTEYIMSHPAFRDCVEEYGCGNSEPFVDLLNTIQLHCVDVQVKNSAKCFGQHKWQNSSDIRLALDAIKLPTNFDVKLKMPLPKDYTSGIGPFIQPIVKPDCRVIDFSSAFQQIKKRVARYFNPCQLSFEFPNNSMTAAC